MDTGVGSPSNVTAGSSPYSLPVSEPDPRLSEARATPDTGPIRSPGLLRRLAGHGWQILWLWLIVSVPICWAILYFMQPTFEAFSLLQIEPTKLDLFGQQQHRGLAEYRRVEPYLNTQAALITSDRVLKNAIARYDEVNLPWIKESEDPTTDLRAEMAVEIVPDAFLIRVALELPDGQEAAAIVNSVVDTYLDVNVKYKQDNNAGQRSTLQEQLKKLESEIKAKKAELKPFYAKGTVDPPKPALNPGAPKNEFDPIQPTFSTLTEEHVQTIINELIKTDLELIKTQSTLGVMEAADPTIKEVNELKIKVAALKKTKENLARYFDALSIHKKPLNNDTFEATFLNYEINSLLKKQQIVKTNLEQLLFEASQEIYRVRRVDPAVAPATPTSNKRTEYLAIAPPAVLFLLISLFLLREIEVGWAARSTRHAASEV